MDSAERFLTWFGKKAKQPTQRVPAEKSGAGTSGSLGLPKHYLLLNEIGSGGMGVLYKAIDTRLHRPVVVKAIRDSLFSDPDLVKRFRKEALATASIDHPYICKIYELLETEGRTLIVMEYVEGETLEQVLARGPLSMTDTVRFAIEISEALGAAHSKGLIHRDIKPSNILITPHRHVKVIDFGLAKALREAGDETPFGMKRERGGGGGGGGGFVGTLCYMSPEQASGGDLDQRSDVFSTGVLLFQCLTGRLPFDGETSTDYVQNLLLEPAPLLRTLVPVAPGELERLVAKCLAKEPSDRFESAEALAAALTQISELISSSQTGQLVIPAPRVSWTRNLAASAAAAAVLAGGAVLGLQWFSEPSIESLFSTRPGKQEAIAPSTAEDIKSRVSPDGKWISFISNRIDGDYNLWLQKTSGGQPSKLTSVTGSIQSSVWSPDSTEIAYLLWNGNEASLNVIALVGGKPRLSVPMEDVQLIRWLGKRIYAWTGKKLIRYEPATDVTETLYEPDRKLRARYFDVSADESALLYTAQSDDKQWDLWRSGLDGANRVQITRDEFEEREGRWLDREGKTVVVAVNRGGEMHLWRLLVDRPEDPQQMTFEAGWLDMPEDVASDGSFLTFKRTEVGANLYKLDRANGSELQLTVETLQDFWPSLSRDTSKVAFQRMKPSQDLSNFFGDTRIYLSSSPSDFQDARLVVQEGYSPSLSPDASRLAFLKAPEQVSKHSVLAWMPELWVQDLSNQSLRLLGDGFGIGAFEVFPLERPEQNLTWSPDSESLYSVHRNADHEELRQYSFRAGDAVSKVIRTTAEKNETIRQPAPSPDGRQLAYVWRSDERGEGAVQVHVRDLHTGSDRVVLEEHIGPGEELLCRGWVDNSTLIAIRSKVVAGVKNSNIEIVEINTTTSGARILGKKESAYAGTARTDAARRMVYLTATEGRADNIFAMRLDSGGWERLTRNEFSIYTYSGVTVTPQGELLYTKQKSNKDIWRIRFED